MTPLVIEIKRRLVGNRRDDRATLPCGYLYDLIEQVEATAEREAKLREACEDYLKWVRRTHHHLPIEETVKQRREILERMEAALEQKGGE